MITGSGSPRPLVGRQIIHALSDTQTWIFCEQALRDSTSLHPQWGSSPVDRYLLDIDGTKFACDYINRTTPNQNCSTVNSGVSLYASTALPNALQRYCMFWFPLDSLPHNITIVEAKLCFYSQTYVTFPGTSVAWAVLDTLKSDEKWLQSGACDEAYPPMRAASWNRTGAADSSGWVPLLDNRDDVHDWGVKGTPSQVSYTVGGSVEMDVTEPVQHYVNYHHANAGFWPMLRRGSQSVWLRAGRDCPDERRPFLKVRFAIRPYSFPWHGHPLAFVVTTDDQDSVNYHYMQTLDSLGYKFTVFVRGDAHPFAGGSSSSKLDLSEIQTILDHGHEVSHHSLNHAAPWGLGEITPTGVDSMLCEIDRGWLMDALRMDASAIRSFAYPSGGFNQLAIRSLSQSGYLGSRCAGAVGTALPAWSDADGSNYLSLEDTCNVFSIERLIADADLFGTTAQDTITSRTIREKLYDVIDKAVTNHHAAIIFYLHDSKSSLLYPNGADPDQFSWLMHHVKDHGRLWVTTFGDLLEEYRDHHVPCDPPSWAPRSRAAGITAADMIWWAPGNHFLVGSPELPVSADIGPIYPNPFNAKTVIQFTVQRRGRIRVQIFDLRGRLVRVLVDESRPAGTHLVEWDGRDDRNNVASGVYLCRFDIAGSTGFKKLVLIK